MPVLRPCLDPNCAKTQEGPWCAEHKPTSASRKARGLTGKRGSGKGWRKLRRRVLKRDGYRCVKCGTPYPLEVDHVNGNPLDDRLENLQSLCAECHHAKHDR